MYNTVYLYVFQYHAKLCLSESLEACCYWKTGWKEEGVTTGGRDNHTVCIFPWCVPWYFVQSDVFMQRQIKHCTHASHTHAHTHTHTHVHSNDSADLGIMADMQGFHRKEQFPIWQLWIHTHRNTHTHTHWMENQPKYPAVPSGYIEKRQCCECVLYSFWLFQKALGRWF